MTPATEVFAHWQPRYAEHGISTFPVDLENKRPRVRGYLKIGSRVSAQLALKFPAAGALGFACGKRSGITVLDVDTPDERVLADAMAELGQSPLVVKTASGKFHAYYRHGGEGRKIRPNPAVPVDFLGGGFCVAPPSQGARGRYEIIEGSFDDLSRLPRMRIPAPPIAPALDTGKLVLEGQRNNALFKACREAAARCANDEELLAFAMDWNLQNCVPPDDHANVIRTAQSAWKYEFNGRKCKARAGEATMLIREPYTYALLCFLRAHNRPGNTFHVTNGLSELLAWDRERLAAARKRLVELGLLEQVRRAYKASAAVYRWPRQ
jgi:Bifunctional DNA primase/polymerase, N-terminal/Primase C terminal 1 (PriCT-1)